MQDSKTTLFQVRLTEAEKRRIKTLAASQGLTLRQATVQAYEAWAEKLHSRALPADPARGAPVGGDLERPSQSKRGSQVSPQKQGAYPRRQTTPRQGQRRAERTPAATPGGSQPSDNEPASRAWLRQAAHLDWSECPAAERVHGKTGDVWVARGTRVPVASILGAVAEGEAFVEIADVFEITLRQLIAILQFAVEHVGAADPAN